MTTYVDGPVSLTVPATSANLGPGFDCLGLALGLRDTVTARVTGSGLDVRVTGEGEGDVALDESHLVVQAMRSAFDELGGQPPGLALRCVNRIPHARGLGSSSAAVVAGAALARALVAGGSLLLDDAGLLRIAADLEGHPDNVAPALHGGLAISGREGDAWFAVSSGIDPRIGAVVFIPPTPLSTQTARGVLPAQVPHADAAANAGRAALLIAALAGQPEHLLTATRDLLHQDYRRPAMPESLALVDALRADGIAAVVSGAGPTVLAFGAAGGLEDLLGRCPDGWRAHQLALDPHGVRPA